MGRSTNQKRRQKTQTLAELVKGRPSAAVVWLALCLLAKQAGSNVITPTRAQLAKLTGLVEKTISYALTALETAGWVDRAHVPVYENGQQTATLLRIVLRHHAASAAPPAAAGQRRGRRQSKGAETPKSTEFSTSSRNGRSTPATDTITVEGVEGAQGKGPSRPQDFPSERGGAPAAPPPHCCGGVGDAPPGQGLGKSSVEPLTEKTSTASPRVPQTAGPSGPDSESEDPDALARIEKLLASIDAAESLDPNPDQPEPPGGS